jgi:hypothetical protein
VAPPESLDLALCIGTGNNLGESQASKADLDRLRSESPIGWIVRALERSSKLTGALDMALGAEESSPRIVAMG